jgi:DNA-directed RNA polymerase specialized sigma24 family protein
VVARRPDGEFFPVGRAQRGEYANETFFLSEEQALDRLAIHILRDAADALAVMSDGLTRLALKLPGYEPHAPFFQPLFAFAAACDDQKDAEQRLAAFLASERVCARTDDDKTLVLAVSQTGDQDFGLTDGKDPG